MTRLSTEVASNEQENDGRADGGSSSKPVTPMSTPTPREPAEIMGTFRNALMDSYPDRHIDHPERQLDAAINEGSLVLTTASSSVLTTSSASSAMSRFSTVILALPASPVRTGNSTNVHVISKSQMKEFREAFRLFDKDGDGSITKEELGRVMRSFGQFARAEELNTMLEEIDIDGDGNVSFEEFVEIVSNIGGANTMAWTDKDQEEQELKDAFKVFDKHNRGYITASDLRAVLQCLGEDLSEEEIEDMIKEVDVDGDGRIDFYEFVHALGESGNDDDEEEEELEDPQSPNL